MNFLHPGWLWALPIISLPILIHLINQRRFQTVHWGAMMFLLSAQRMSRGYTRIRQWLILLMRTLAVLGVVIVLTRPLASGWLGFVSGGTPDTTLILLDRSPSMQQTGGGTGVTKLQAGVQQLVETLKLFGSTHWVLIDSGIPQPRELSSPEELRKWSETPSPSASASLPAMLELAQKYLQQNQSGRTEVWICSDLRESDWDSANGRWKQVRDAFQQWKPGVRIHLLAFAGDEGQNVAVQVQQVSRRGGEHPELSVTVKLTRRGGGGVHAVPLQFEIDGARSVVPVEMTSDEYLLKDHRIPLSPKQTRGWGTVTIPADHNTADNVGYFTFESVPPRKGIVVVEDDAVGRVLEIAAAIPPEGTIPTSAVRVSAAQLRTLEWEQVSTVFWQGGLPEPSLQDSLKRFVERGGTVIFFPPRAPKDETFLGVGWDQWQEGKPELTVESWQGDQDLLTRTLSGTALPVGQVQIRRCCRLTGKVSPIATLSGGIPLLVRVSTPHGGVYFCTTTPASGDSSLASNGIVLYVVIHRLMAAGGESLRTTDSRVAGVSTLTPTTDETRMDWQRLAGRGDLLPTEYLWHAGVYRTGEQLFSLNRSDAEDQPAIVDDAQLQRLFAGLDFFRMDVAASNPRSLIQEIWRAFMGMILVALVAEALLCLPRRTLVVRPAEPWRPAA